MSEEEKKLRLGYRKIRKRWITIQSVILAVVLAITLLAAIFAKTFDKTYYVNYSEKSSIDYGVQLKDNDFYDDSYLGKDYAYIASLIDKVQTQFNYELKMQSNDLIDFEYAYRVDAVVQIKNKMSGKVLFSPVYNEIAQKEYSSTDTGVSIYQTVSVDYNKYNDIADRFINTYNLTGTEANLVLQMHVNVIGTSNEFRNDKNSNSYVASVSIPLTTQTVEVKITSSVPSEKQKILSYTTESTASIFRTVAIVSASVGALLAIILLAFTYLSRNVDITYDIKVSRLVRNYKSFVQRIRNSFDVVGYQVLIIDTFEEMLEIRDTIQSPILMEENEDRTCTKFLIPTNTKLLYLFEIKVDDYDEIYNSKSTDTETKPTDGSLSEETIITEEPIENSITSAQSEEFAPETAVDIPAEASEEEDVEDLSSENDDDDVASIAYIDDAGKISIACNRSFTANLIQSNEQVKSYYSALKNRILSYKKVKARISWRFESYNRGRTQLFKMKIRGKTICLYCALDPKEFDRAKYFHEQATAKSFASVPMLVRVRSDRGLKKALGLVDAVMQKFAISEAANPKEADYSKDYPYETTKQLVERNLIKILLPGATAAEPKPHHHVHKKKITVARDDVVEELTIFDADEVTPEEIDEMIETPTPALEEIDYDDDSEPTDDLVETTDQPGVDVIGVVWPERPKRNKIYRYDPDGEVVGTGDVVIVPTRDASRNRDVIRKAVVAHENHRIDPDSIKHPLKKIIGVIQRKTK